MFKLIQTFSARANFNTADFAGAGAGVDTSAITEAAQAAAAVNIAVAVATIEAGAIMNPAQGAKQVAGKI